MPQEQEISCADETIYIFADSSEEYCSEWTIKHQYDWKVKGGWEPFAHDGNGFYLKKCLKKSSFN